MKTYADILNLQIAAHTKDWTLSERAAILALVTQLSDVFWKSAKREPVNLAGLKTALRAIAKTRRVKAVRVASLTNIQFALEIARELDFTKAG